MRGGYGDDRLYGQEDDDWLYGEVGDDWLYGGYDDDYLEGNEGDDELYGEGGADTLHGGEGNDYLDGGTGADYLSGGVGNDTYVIDNEGDIIEDLGSIDDIDRVVVLNSMTFNLGETLEDAELDNQAGDSGLVGNSLNNSLTGNDSDNTLDAGLGSDDLNGNDGNDAFTLTPDAIWTGNFMAMNTAKYQDVATNQQIRLEGYGRFTDTVDGGSDADTLYLTAASEAFFMHDSYSPFNKAKTLEDDGLGKQGSQRISEIEAIYAGDGDDIIDVTSPKYSLARTDMEILGESGNDTIWAGEGDDTLNGGIGLDTLFGGSGDDVLIGGKGADTFEFTQSADDDKITDYEAGVDTIKLYYRDTDTTEVNFANNQLEWGQIEILIEGVTSIEQLTIDWVLI